jgi:pimeloyl-ACP methyl ester carboxylesterase
MAVQESLRVPAYVWQSTVQGLLEDDFVDELANVHAPTLILWGARDTFCPRVDQEVLLAKISSARLTVYEEAGHALHWEEPVRFAGDVVAFAHTLSGVSTAHGVSPRNEPNEARSGNSD